MLRKNKIHVSSPWQVSGFTLIELITVLVILGIVAAIGSNFLVTTVDTYDTVQKRTKLLNRGRMAIEQMARQIRISLPNSIRVSGSGNCIEFMPVVAGASYLSDVPDNENLAPATSAIATSPFTLNFGTAAHVAVAGLDASEIYATGSGVSRVSVGALGAGPSYTSIPLASTHRFIRNSSTRRVYVAADPQRFCLIGTTLLEYSGYGLTTAAVSDLAPVGASSSVIAENVSANGVAFTLSAGSEDINTSVDIALNFSNGSNAVSLTQQVLVRNVP